MLQVKDSGCGISPQDIPHLFTKFTECRGGTNRSQGTGLGLAICKRYNFIMTLSSQNLLFVPRVTIYTIHFSNFISEMEMIQLEKHKK